MVGGEHPTDGRPITRSDAVDLYRERMLHMALMEVEIPLWDLRGKNLACWCPLDQPCHADFLLELANGYLGP